MPYDSVVLLQQFCCNVGTGTAWYWLRPVTDGS